MNIYEFSDNWRELISQPKYEVIRESNVSIKMRDGVHLSVNIFRPKGEESFQLYSPCLLTARRCSQSNYNHSQ